MQRYLAGSIAAVVTAILFQGCGGGNGAPLAPTSKTGTVSFTAITTAGLGFAPKSATIERFWLPPGVTAEAMQSVQRTVALFENYSAGLNRLTLMRIETDELRTNPFFDGLKIFYDPNQVSPQSIETRIQELNPSLQVILDGQDGGTSMRKTVGATFSLTLSP